jgi:hypothetical protein
VTGVNARDVTKAISNFLFHAAAVTYGKDADLGRLFLPGFINNDGVGATHLLRQMRQ